MIDTLAVVALTLFCMVACLFIGWHFRTISDAIKSCEQRIKSWEIKELEEQSEAPKSMILEPKPETPTQRAKREQEELLEGLNR